MRCLAVALALSLPAAGVAGQSPATAEDPGVVIIVSADVQGTQIPRTVLSSIFLAEASRWGDGRPVTPVDQSLRSPVRAAFTDRVLRMPLDGIQSLWHRKLIDGAKPPAVKVSDDEVIAFVARTEGAIGYVTPEAALPETVKVIGILD